MARRRLRRTRIVFGPDGKPRWVKVVDWGEVAVLGIAIATAAGVAAWLLTKL